MNSKKNYNVNWIDITGFNLSRDISMARDTLIFKQNVEVMKINSKEIFITLVRYNTIKLM